MTYLLFSSKLVRFNLPFCLGLIGKYLSIVILFFSMYGVSEAINKPSTTLGKFGLSIHIKQKQRAFSILCVCEFHLVFVQLFQYDPLHQLVLEPKFQSEGWFKEVELQPASKGGTNALDEETNALDEELSFLERLYTLARFEVGEDVLIQRLDVLGSLGVKSFTKLFVVTKTHPFL